VLGSGVGLSGKAELAYGFPSVPTCCMLGLSYKQYRYLQAIIGNLDLHSIARVPS